MSQAPLDRNQVLFGLILGIIASAVFVVLPLGMLKWML
jgi:hypothetical protein